MAAGALSDRYAANLHGVLSCYDRIIVTGTLPGACYAAGMTSFLYSRGIRIFDYPRFAEPLRDRIRERAQQVCEAAGVQIEHVNKSHIRKEELVARVLAVRGDAVGLVHVISAMEACPSYKPWHDKTSGKTFLRPEQGKCLHYYFYFIDEEFGLCYLRVPTWAPFGLQFYCNGHSALARSLRREGIEFVQEDNAFLRVADLARAQALADAFNPERLHRRLKRYAHWLCPVADVFVQDDWHWSIRQVEYSTDLTSQIWVPLRTYTTAFNEWREEIIQIGPSGEIPASPAIRLRFTATDADPGNIVEAGLDTLRVERFECVTPVTCVADTNGDGTLSPADFSAWIAAFNAGAPQCDQNADTLCTPADFSAWIANYNAGCD